MTPQAGTIVVSAKPKAFPAALLILLLFLDSSAWLMAKLASNVAAGEHTNYLAGLLDQPWMWLALAIGPLQLYVWTRILASAEISLAFPLTSLAYPITIGASVLLFHEELTWRVWVGVVLITLGAAVLDPARQTNCINNDSSKEDGENDRIFNH